MRAGLSPAEVGVGTLPTGSHSGMCSVQSLRKDRLAGMSARVEADRGCSLAALKAAGYNAKDLLTAGFTPTQLHDAGFSAAQLAAAGVMPAQLKAAGYTAIVPVQSSGNNNNQGASNFSVIPSALSSTPEGRLKALQLQQQRLLARSQLENKKQQIYTLLNSEASQLLRGWAKKSSQKYVEGKPDSNKGGVAGAIGDMTGHGNTKGSSDSTAADPNSKVIKAGSIMFGILTTGSNTDEQSPILAKVISGKLKAAS